jgi:molybdopterin synthase catalytic subunit
VHIRVLYFAVLRERIGQEGDTLELPRASTVAQACDALVLAHPGIASLLPRIQVAVNRSIVGPEHVLRDKDEVALIPPVSGGSGSAGRTGMRTRPLDLAEAIRAVEGPGQGAIVTFTGAVRRDGLLSNVVRLEYEAYVPMAEDVLGAIAGEIEGARPYVRVAIFHRTGVLRVGDDAVVVAVSAPHRADAFEACREAIDQLKRRAPIWKKEVGEDGSEWVGLGP